MKKYLNKLLSRHITGQAGHALVLVLVFLLLGSLTLAPVLAHMATALKTGTKYENKTSELSTADAGIENGLWRIKYDSLGRDSEGKFYDVYDYTTVWTYLTNPVNGREAEVTIENLWMPTTTNLTSLGISPAQAKTMVESEKLVITGTSSAPGQPFHVKMDFTPAEGDNLTIKSIGVWLPQGFSYQENSCDLEELDSFDECHPDHVDDDIVPGGRAVVWSFDQSYPLFIDFPNFVSENNTMTITFGFDYTPPPDNPDLIPVAVAWVTCEMHDAFGNPALNPNAIENVPLAWDTGIRYYKITSSTGNTRIETYSARSELRSLGNATPGDYLATGNSLMTDDNHDNIREHLYASSDATVSTIPEDADVISAYLYWSGWRNEGQVNMLSDDCSTFNNWDRYKDDESQTRYPSGDFSYTGTWDKTTDMYSYVDEEDSHDGDTTYLRAGTAVSSVLFSFPAFDVPAGSIIQNLTVYLVARDDTDGKNRIQPVIRVNGADRMPNYVDVSGSYEVVSYVCTTNPLTGVAWTVEDINGTGDNPLQYFGINSSDADPELRITQVYAQVNYSESRWSIYSGQFRGQGSSSATVPQRTLTLNSLDMSSYAPGTVVITWDQTVGGLEENDALYLAFSGNGGSTWSGNFEVFHGGSPDSPFYYIIPDDYVTGNYKMRFYFNFDDAAEYVNIDNIKVSYLPPDTSVTFMINDVQYSLSANGTPLEGGYLTAGDAQVFPSLFGSSFAGFSYACHRDVSALVTKYPVVPGEEHHNGNYKYTVGDVTATTGHHLSYAGWSLIIIYSSPSTAGHYLYLRDVFSFHPGTGQNLDFDGDGQPGGDITGFKIPKPITNKDGAIVYPVAAKLTCFVGEGDEWRTGEYIQITGQQSGESKYLTNNTDLSNDVWNGWSPELTKDGIDIDTFEVLWSDGILTSNDERLHVDMWAGGYYGDAYNLIYFILSIRSMTDTRSTGHYIIGGN